MTACGGLKDSRVCLQQGGIIKKKTNKQKASIWSRAYSLFLFFLFIFNIYCSVIMSKLLAFIF